MATARRSAVKKRIVFLVVLAGLVIVTLAAARQGLRLYAGYEAIKQRLDRVEALVAGDQGVRLSLATVQELRRELAGGQSDVAALQRDLAPFLPIVSRLGWAPIVGPSVAAAPHILAMGEHFLGAASLLFDGLEPLLSLMLAESSAATTASLTERALPPLLAAQPHLATAYDLVERAAAERAKIGLQLLLPPLARQMERLDKYLPALRSGSQMATLAPVLLGAMRPMNYILLAQNNDELRPTGGFISAVGVLSIDRGTITRLDITDSYSIDNWDKDHPFPPEPLTRFMDSQLWVFRDANYWPDYPTSARAVAYFAELDLDIEADGVIALDQYALAILVGGMGTVVVPEYQNDTLTRANTIGKIRSYWQAGKHFGTTWKDWLPWYDDRKQFMTYLVQAMRARVEKDPRSLNLTQFGKAVLEALNEKHILVYLREPLGGGLGDAANWGGAISSGEGDYLYVVDTNMGFNKANGLIQRSLDYAVALDADGLARSQLVVSYQHNGKRDIACVQESYYEATYELMMDRCYWNWLRVYTPLGATLVADENGNDMESAPAEAGRQVWARWMVISPGEAPQAAMGYYQLRPVLRAVAGGREYRLIVQKQPGTDVTPLTVSVTLPAGASVAGVWPSAKSVSGNVVRFESNLETDQEFRILVR